MRALIRFFDSLLRRFKRVYEFTGDPECLLRLQLIKAPHRLDLRNRSIPAGEDLLEIHLWNEHLPPLPPGGPDLVWALRAYRMFVRSLREVAREIGGHPSRYAGIRAVGAATGALSYGRHASGAVFLRQLGFQVMQSHPRLGRFGEFWENAYSRLLMRAFNPQSLRPRKNKPLHRMELWMPVGEFMRVFGGSLSVAKRA
jgi:hypothetical protein